MALGSSSEKQQAWPNRSDRVNRWFTDSSSAWIILFLGCVQPIRSFILPSKLRPESVTHSRRHCLSITLNLRGDFYSLRTPDGQENRLSTNSGNMRHNYIFGHFSRLLCAQLLLFHSADHYPPSHRQWVELHAAFIRVRTILPKQQRLGQRPYPRVLWHRWFPMQQLYSNLGQPDKHSTHPNRQ